MATKPLPSPEELRQLLRYEPETGKLFWKERGAEHFKDGYRTAEGNAVNWNSQWANKEAFTALGAGYHQGSVKFKKLYAHRVIWAMTYNIWPDVIDHIDGDRINNRIDNLRNVTQKENMRNATLWSHNTSGYSGVCWVKRIQKWTVTIKVSGKNIFIGNFVDKQDAINARELAEKEHGFHPNHGRAK